MSAYWEKGCFRKSYINLPASFLSSYSVVGAQLLVPSHLASLDPK